MTYIKRYIEKRVIEDLQRKMVFIGGSRQTGKTTLAKNILKQKGEEINERYYNWDSGEDRENIIRINSLREDVQVAHRKVYLPLENRNASTNN